MNIILKNIEEVGPHTYTFWFSSNKPVDYTAGQFIEMYLPHDDADSRGQKHWFTLSSSPTEELISITTKQATERMSTFKQILFSMKLGTSVHISEPMGDFVLPKDASIPLVFVIGGIGITPVRSILKYLSDVGEARDVHVIYGAKTVPDLVFLGLIEDYNAKLDIVLSEPSDNWTGKTGHLSGKIVMDVAGDLQEPLFYVSGPEPMTEKIEHELLELGVSKDKLVLDFFPGYSPEA